MKPTAAGYTAGARFSGCQTELGTAYAPCSAFQALGLAQLFRIPQTTFYWLHAGGTASQGGTNALYRTSAGLAPQVACPASQTIGFFHSWDNDHVDGLSCNPDATVLPVLCCRRNFF
jgi:hypothetical protein